MQIPNPCEKRTQKKQTKKHADIQTSMSHAPTRHPDHQPTHIAPRGALPIAPLSRLVDELIEGGIDVIGELDLSHGAQALGGCAEGEADDALLGQRGVEDAVGAKFGGQVDAAAKDAAKGDVLAENEDALVVAQRLREGPVHGLEQVLPRCRRAAGQ